MKKLISIVLVALMAMSFTLSSVAEEKSSLSDFSSRLKSKGTSSAQSSEVAVSEDDGLSYGPPVKVIDPFYQKTRSSAYIREDKYSKQANVMIELKNVSGRTLYPNTATVSAYSVDGTLLDEETYSSVGPDMVVNGGNLYIWDWFYGFDYAVADIAYYLVTVESDTDSYTKYDTIFGEAMVADGVAYALVENTNDYDIYGVDVTVCVENEEGILLDVCNVNTSNAVGIFPGSVMILRGNVEDYQNDTDLLDGKATAIVLHQID